MSLCAHCGMSVQTGPNEHFHEYHTIEANEWAIGNRIVCDFVHRGIVPSRLTPDDRKDDFWGNTIEEVAF